MSAGVPIGPLGLGAYANALYGAEPPGAFIEVRWKLPGEPMRQRFAGVRDSVELADLVARLAVRADVFVGVAPRSRRSGGRDAVERVHVLWADVDGAEALAALRRFRPLPAIVVASGSPDSCHAYWPLWPPVGPDQAERGNRRIAHTIGADMRSTDAARILRPPGTLNHKHDPPGVVELRHLEVEIYSFEDVVGELAEPPRKRSASTFLPAAQLGGAGGDDGLRSQSAALALIARHAPEAELRPGGDGRLHGRCPLPTHIDKNPSFALFPDGGYVCSCGSGDLIRLAVELRGEIFLAHRLPFYRRDLELELGLSGRAAV